MLEISNGLQNSTFPFPIVTGASLAALPRAPRTQGRPLCSEVCEPRCVSRGAVSLLEGGAATARVYLPWAR